MNRRLPILAVALVLLVALGVIWKSVSDAPTGLEDLALEGPGLEMESPAASTETEELSAAPVVATKEVESQREVAAPEPKAVEAAFSVPDDSLWIEGRVVFPDRLPLDEEYEVKARGRRFGKDKKAPREHRVKAERDGSFRVAFGAKTKKGWLDVDARYMYLESRVKVDPKKQADGVKLTPVLGGLLRGTIAPPPGLERNAETFDGVSVRMNEWRNDTWFDRGTKVEADGSFELRGLPPSGGYELKLESGRHGGMGMENVGILAGEVTEVELSLQPGILVAGHVRTPQGEPIAGVDVRLMETRQRNGGTNSTSNSVKTDEEGAFEFAGIDPCSAKLTIRAEGSTEIIDELGELEAGDRRDDLVYTPTAGSSVSGMVNWEDGKPAVGVTVKARPVEEGGRLDWNAREIIVKTDEAGRFELEGLDQRTVVIDASGRRLVEEQKEGKPKRRKKRGPTLRARMESVQPGTRGLHLTLSRGEVLSGSVTFADGRPTGKFFVEAHPDWSGSGTLTWQDRIERSFESEIGEYELAGLKPGAWRVSVRGKDFAETEAQVIEVPYEGRLDFIVSQSASVKGIVKTPDGTLLGGAEITKVEINGTSQSWTNDHAKTNGEGAFKLTSLQPGDYQISAKATGWSSSASVAITLAPGELREGIVLVVRPACRVTGQILPGAGEVSGRRITVWGGDNHTNENTTSDANGRFEFTNLGAGKFTARLEPESQGETDWQVHWANTPTEEFELLAGGSAHIELGAGAAQPVRIHGRITSGGTGASNYVVHVNGGKEQNQGATRTAADGSYSLEVDGPGTYSLTVRPSGTDFGVNYLVYHIEVKGSGDHRADFDLPIATLALTLISPDGSPAAGAQVSLEALEDEKLKGNVHQGQSSDAQGEFTFQHLNPGKYLLHAGGAHPWNPSEPKFARQLIEVRLADSENRELTIQLEDSGSVSGLATYSDGAPAGGQLVKVLDEQGRLISNQWTHTESSGSYRIEGMPSGRLTVRIGGEKVFGEASVNLSKGGNAQVSVSVPR